MYEQLQLQLQSGGLEDCEQQDACTIDAWLTMNINCAPLSCVIKLSQHPRRPRDARGREGDRSKEHKIPQHSVISVCRVFATLLAYLQLHHQRRFVLSKGRTCISVTEGPPYKFNSFRDTIWSCIIITCRTAQLCRFHC